MDPDSVWAVSEHCKESSSADSTQKETNWDPEHKVATLQILERETKDKMALHNPELCRKIIDGVQNAKTIDEYIKVPPGIAQAPLFR